MADSGIPTQQTPFTEKDDNGVFHVTWPWLKWFQDLQLSKAKATVFFSNTHAKRVTASAGSYASGTVFYENDRTVYYVAVAADWLYLSGVYVAPLASLPVGLALTDAGFLFRATDYAHTLRWTGVGWTWADDDQSGRIDLRIAAPVPAVGWHLCDGTQVNRLNADGSVTAVTLPDFTTGAYLKAGIAADAGAQAASGATDDTTAANNTAATGVTAQNAATGVTVAAHTGADASNGGGAAIKVFQGAGDLAHTVADPQHTHALTDPHHTHVQVAHHHAAGTLELRRMQLQAWYRQ